MEFLLLTLLILSITSAGVISAPDKFDAQNGGFIPSNLRYYNEPLQIKNISNSQLSVSNTNKIESKSGKDNPTQRFGLSGYGNTGTGSYPNSGSGVSSYHPVKIDIGGVVLGTLIGFGAILIIPKLAHIFSGGYRRSIESEMETITAVLTKIDKALEEHNIDSSVCLQRIVCSYVQESEKGILSDEPSTMDNLIHALTNNSIVSFLMDGTAIQQAIKLGKKDNPDSCAPLYAQCPISKSNALHVISNLLPA